MTSRKNQAFLIRQAAAQLAADRVHPHHTNNGEEYEHRHDGGPSHIANYTKGLPHDFTTGLLLNSVDYKLFVTGIQSGKTEDFMRTPLGPPSDDPSVPGTPTKEAVHSGTFDRSVVWYSDIAVNYQGRNDPDTDEYGARVRAWESAGAGNVFDLEGPDSQAVTMPPAPRIDSDEAQAELAEVYAMALLRDEPFANFPGGEGTVSQAFKDTAEMLAGMPWFSEDEIANADEESRKRFLDPEGSDLFRGQTPGEDVGPYLSQFLLVGNSSFTGKRKPTDGKLRYGAISIDHRIEIATPGKDYMTTWQQWFDVQNGADLRGAETYLEDDFRFITTPRDLATYVHHDALYEAYLNACLFLLSSGAPFDRGIPFLEGDTFDKQQGFAHFGGPHILTLVTEVATRALKAVRYQKFNIHRRLRPEAMGGCLNACRTTPGFESGPLAPFESVLETFKDLKRGSSFFMDDIRDHNAAQNSNHWTAEPDHGDASYLLPMAFPEGSPMHPSYGAGHATVAGACITILKAYFDHGWTPSEWMDVDDPIAWEPSVNGDQLNKVNLDSKLTIEGELNKLAANIAIGRNWAGVHYYTDYIESMRMGEEIALGLLEEQKLTYPENFTMTVPLFDGGAVRI